MRQITVHHGFREKLEQAEARLQEVIREFASEGFTPSRFYAATGGEPAEIALAKEAIELRSYIRELRQEITAGEYVRTGQGWSFDEIGKTFYVNGITLDMRYVPDRTYTGGPSSMSYIDTSYWISPLGVISI